jgi:hypothetical protein
MNTRTIVHAHEPDAEPADAIASRLSGQGVQILSRGPYQFLVSGKKDEVAQALGEAKGWAVSEETFVPPPSTRVSVKRPPQ